MNAFAAEIEAIGRAGGDPRTLSAILNRCLDWPTTSSEPWWAWDRMPTTMRKRVTASAAN